MKKLLSMAFIAALVLSFTAQSGTIVCPESSVKCSVTRNFPDGSSETVESEKGAKRGAIEIEE